MLGLIVGIAYLSLAIGVMDGLQDTAESQTSGAMQALFQAVTPIATIFLGVVAAVAIAGGHNEFDCNYGTHKLTSAKRRSLVTSFIL